MKKLILFFFAIISFSFNVQAISIVKLDSLFNITNYELFKIGLGNIYKTEITKIDTWKIGKGLISSPLSFFLERSTDVKTGKTMQALRIEFLLGNEGAYVDIDDISNILNDIELLNQITQSNPTKETKVTLANKGGLDIVLTFSVLTRKWAFDVEMPTAKGGTATDTVVLFESLTGTLNKALELSKTN